MSLLKKHESTVAALVGGSGHGHPGSLMASPDLPDPTPLRFGPFELRPQTRQLLRRGAEVAIGGRAFDLLCALALRRQRVVSSDELLQIVWPGQSVEPNNLQVQIWALRKLLGPRVITTVARRGYRFLPALANPHQDHGSQSTPHEDHRLQAVLDLVQDHRLVTLLGDDDGALLQLALACAHRLADPLGGMVWQLDAAALTRTEHADGSSILDCLPRPDVDRADVLVLRRPAGPVGDIGPALQCVLAQAQQIRLLLVSAQALGLPQEQVVPVVMHRPHRPQSSGRAALRWQARGPHR